MQAWIVSTDCQHGLSVWMVSTDCQHKLQAEIANTQHELPAQIEKDNRNKNLKKKIGFFSITRNTHDWQEQKFQDFCHNTIFTRNKSVLPKKEKPLTLIGAYVQGDFFDQNYLSTNFFTISGT